MPQRTNDGSRPRRRRVAALSALALVVALVVGYLGVGHRLFDVDHSDSLTRADAVIVLGGEHDGREEYGLSLAREGYAKTVVLSDPYPANDPVMRTACRPQPDIDLICFRPSPSTTRGEAMFTQHLADQHGWTRVIVVTWRYHLVRARYIFGQCFNGAVTMRSVPREYPAGLSDVMYNYAYQFTGIAKAFALGCPASTTSTNPRT